MKMWGPLFKKQEKIVIKGTHKDFFCFSWSLLLALSWCSVCLFFNLLANAFLSKEKLKSQLLPCILPFLFILYSYSFKCKYQSMQPSAELLKLPTPNTWCILQGALSLPEERYINQPQKVWREEKRRAVDRMEYSEQGETNGASEDSHRYVAPYLSCQTYSQCPSQR